MKKIVIPAILAATILIAGMFAFMPVEKASTVHTSIGVGKAASANNAANNVDVTVFDLTAGSLVAIGSVCVKATDDGAGGTSQLVELTIQTGSAHTLINNANTEAGSCADFAGKKMVLKAGDSALDTVDYSVAWRES